MAIVASFFSSPQFFDSFWLMVFFWCSPQFLGLFFLAHGSLAWRWDWMGYYKRLRIGVQLISCSNALSRAS